MFNYFYRSVSTKVGLLVRWLVYLTGIVFRLEVFAHNEGRIMKGVEEDAGVSTMGEWTCCHIRA